MTTPICKIDATGLHVPSLSDVLAYLKAEFRRIHGDDIYIENDSQDGQFLGIVAAALDDANSMTVAAYNSRGPATAQGVGLSSIVKINGIRRKIATYSTCDVVLVGQAGARIDGGKVQDAAGFNWSLPDGLFIPNSGQLTVTATCDTLGAISAPANTINQIATPTAGWQSVSNPNAAAQGAPVESDSALRQRQAVSTALPSQTILDGLDGALRMIPGVAALRIYENSGEVADASGIPAHTIAVVIDGGDSSEIAATIARKKGPGCGAFGTTTTAYVDAAGVKRMVAYSRPINIDVTYNVTIKSLGALTLPTQQAIRQSVSDWTNAVGIGNGILLPRVYMPAQLHGGAGYDQFEIVSVAMARDGLVPVLADIAMAFNERPFCIPDYVTVTVI